MASRLIPASIFNEVIGPVMRGCSSSHVAAALRIGLLARDFLNGQPERAIVRFDKSEALSLSYDGQGSAMGFVGGLLGDSPDSELLPFAKKRAVELGIHVEFKVEDVSTSHPNTYLLELYEEGNDQQYQTMEAVSLGGGAIEIRTINGASVSLFGDTYTTIFTSAKSDLVLFEADSLPSNILQVIPTETATHRIYVVTSVSPLTAETITQLSTAFETITIQKMSPVMPVLAFDSPVPFRTAKEMLSSTSDPHITLSDLACDYEAARSWKSRSELSSLMTELAQTMRQSIEIGRKGTTYSDRILTAQSPLLLQAGSSPLLGSCLHNVTTNVTAIMDCKSAMEVIVAAPTAGACGVLGGTVWAVAEEFEKNEQEVAEALLAAGIVGVFIAETATFAGEEGGCQVECGSASAMTAAAIVNLLGGSAQQAVDAASMALQNMLGIVCDTICDRVEVPCLGRNILGAVNAVSCAAIIQAGFTNSIPLDETIEALQQISQQMPLELRCTGLGGLAQSLTAQNLLQTYGSNSGKNS